MDRSRDLRRVGRRLDQRAYRANKARLASQEIVDTHYRRKQRTHKNWRVVHEPGGDIVAVEPNRDYEHVFEGGKDPYMEALEYAAQQLRKELADADTDRS